MPSLLLVSVALFVKQAGGVNELLMLLVLDKGTSERDLDIVLH